MNTGFVSGRLAPQDWVLRILAGAVIHHLDPRVIARGERVIASLPLNLVGEVGGRGGIYSRRCIDLPAEPREWNLTAGERRERVGRIDQCRAMRLCAHAALASEKAP